MMTLFSLLLLLLVVVDASHFRGGIITMKPVASENKTMKITFYVSYRRTHSYAAGCNSDLVSDKKLVGYHPSTQGIHCVEGCPKKQLITRIRYICADFSPQENWELGEGNATHSFYNASKVKLSATGCCWIRPFGGASWDLFLEMDLAIRTDTLQINSSPTARFFPMTRIQAGCDSIIRILTYDDDNDIVRCRWGNVASKECHSEICDGFPDAVLDATTCTITYNAPANATGYKVAAIMLEDFSRGDTSFERPLSKVALNFMVLVYKSDLDCAEAKPRFLPPTPFHRSCIAVPRGKSFQGQILVNSNSGEANIKEIRTVIPVGVIKSQLTRVGERDAYVNITWTPQENDFSNNNVKDMCFSAVSSNNQQTEERCIQWVAGVSAPKLIQPASTDILTVDPVNPDFKVQFDQGISRGIIPAKVRFKLLPNNEEIYSLSVNDNASLGLVEFTQRNIVKVVSFHQFKEREHYSMSFDQGFAKGDIGCRADSIASVPIEFIVRDVTPPVITFVKNIRRSNGSAVIEWAINEQTAKVECIVYNEDQNEKMVEKIGCGTGVWQKNELEEGTHRLEVIATDSSGNRGSSSIRWIVDKTPPRVILFPPFKGNITNQVSPRFRLLCPRGEVCKFYCRFGPSRSELLPQPCENGVFLTPEFYTESYLHYLAEDEVGNRGKGEIFTWISDLSPPTLILSSSELAIKCDASLSALPPPVAKDDMDGNPQVTFSDNGSNGDCEVLRTWIATDEAGNRVTANQTIKLIFKPKLNYMKNIQLLCDAAQPIVIPGNTANTDNTCGRNVTLTFSDNATNIPCPGKIVRTWQYGDPCDPSAELGIAKQTITFIETCPQSACGRNVDPPRGTCNDGRCICKNQWVGSNCDENIISPIILNPGNAVIQEGSIYKTELKVSSGTLPFDWDFLRRPQSMSITKGLIEWECDEVGEFQIEVIAKNIVGNSTVSWKLTCTPAYKTYLNELQKDYFLKPEPITFTGFIEYLPGNSLEGRRISVPVKVLIEVSGTTRIYEVHVDTKNMFSLTFEPLLAEYGTYTAVSKHPGAIPSEDPKSWTVLGMRFVDPVLKIQEKSGVNVNLNLSNVTRLVNDGPADLGDVEVDSIVGLSSDIKLQVTFIGKQRITSLGKDTSIPVDLSIKAVEPFGMARAYVSVKSSEGVYALLIINLIVSKLEPILISSPAKVEVEMLRGKQKIIQINIKNSGEAVASAIKADVPNVAMFSVSKFGDSNYAQDPQDLPPDKSLLLVMQISPSIDSELGQYTGNFAIGSDTIHLGVPFKIYVTSNALSSVTFRVEDEYTYFAEDKPLVDKAHVRIRNGNRGILLNDTTKDGYITFEDIPEEKYEVYVNAPKHQSERYIFSIKSGSNSIRIFLKRTAVTYRWTVVPTSIEDVYKIKIEADFETRVPIPVVTIYPKEIDLEPYELGLQNSIQFNVTNHGLIRVERTALRLPENYPLLEFHILAQPDHLDALSSVIIPVKVIRRAPKGRRKRATSCPTGGFKFSYECGGWVLRDISIGFNVNGSCGRAWRPYGGLASGYLSPSGSTSPYGTILCNPCVQSFIECVWDLLPIGQLASIPEIISYANVLAGEPNEEDVKVVNNHLENMIKEKVKKGLGDLIKGSHGDSNSDSSEGSLQKKKNSKGLMKKSLGKLFNLVQSCGANIAEKCELYNYLPGPLQKPAKEIVDGISSIGRKKRGVKETVVRDYIKALEPLLVLIKWKRELYGDDIWMLHNNWDWFQTYFLPIISDDSDNGKIINQNELKQLIGSTKPDYIDKDDVEKFALRWNASFQDWQTGRLEPDEHFPDRISYSKIRHYKSEVYRLNQLAVDAGFSSYIEQFNEKLVEIRKLNPNEKDEEGICAVVRIQIGQDLALTREGFVAKFEIENGERAALRNINVTIVIKNSESGEAANEFFSIGYAKLGGSLKSDGSLNPKQSGEMEWLMIPYSDAAPSDEVYYNVGGTLHYDIEGTEVNAPLLPATIRVMPDPHLYIHYFWEKFVLSDDPFTEKIEPAIPFTPIVAVRNGGNGTAYSLRLTSGQPEIIDNEKGLYVNFKMIGASVGNVNVTPSLSVNFGDVTPGVTVIAKWWMVCSLKGKFQNYSATFENDNPLGDPRLSLIDELLISELIREIYIIGMDQEDDTKGDFLVNEKTDLEIIPDRVYSSLTLKNYPVTHQAVQSFDVNNQNKENLGVTLNTTSDSGGFVYFRQELPISEPDQVSLASASLMKNVGNSKETLPRQNAWLTTLIGEKTSENLVLHVFDYITDQQVGEDVIYVVDFGSDIHAGLVVLRATAAPPVTADIQPIDETTTISPMNGSTPC